jgi:hypothetical protein
VILYKNPLGFLRGEIAKRQGHASDRKAKRILTRRDGGMVDTRALRAREDNTS